MSNNNINLNFINTEPSHSFSLNVDIPTGPPPTYMSSGGGSESGLTPKVISISFEKETKVFPDSSYISPKQTSKSPKNPPPLKRSYSIFTSVSTDDKFFPDSSYISPDIASKSFQDPPPLKRCRAIALTFDSDYEKEEVEVKKKKVKKIIIEDNEKEEKEKKIIFKSGPKIKIPSDFNPDIPKNVINFLRNLNKEEFNFIMSRGYIVKAGDLHDKKIKKVVLELRNYHGIVVEKKK